MLSNSPLGLSVTQAGCKFFRVGVYFLIGLTMMPVEVAKYEINMDLKAQTWPVWGRFISVSLFDINHGRRRKKALKYYSDCVHTVDGTSRVSNCTKKASGST